MKARFGSNVLTQFQVASKFVISCFSVEDTDACSSVTKRVVGSAAPYPMCIVSVEMKKDK